MGTNHPAGIIGYLPPEKDGCKLSPSCLTCPRLQPDCDGDPETAVDLRRRELILRLLKKGFTEARIAAAGGLTIGYVADVRLSAILHRS